MADKLVTCQSVAHSFRGYVPHHENEECVNPRESAQPKAAHIPTPVLDGETQTYHCGDCGEPLDEGRHLARKRESSADKMFIRG